MTATASTALLLLACVLLAPLIAAVILGFIGDRPGARLFNVAASTVTAGAALLLAAHIIKHGPVLALSEAFHLDALSALVLAITTFVTLTTSLHSVDYMHTECARGRFSRAQQRIYHAMFQFIAFALGLALSANNMGILWVAMEGATLATVLIVSLDRSRPALQAAWKFFVLCGVGILQALFGTVLLYMAAERVIGADEGALLWTHLAAIRTRLDPQIITLAFALLFVGYGTKMGLVPFHGWLPDAHAEGPTPVTAVLSGLLLGVALHAILRCKILADGALQTPVAGQLMIGFGLLSVLLAALLLARQQDLRKLLAWSSVEHMGILAIAFGLGGAAATLAGLMHLLGHALVKSGLYFSAAQAVQWSGTGQISGIRGLLGARPTLAWSLLLGTIAILGLPPFSLFPSEFMTISILLQRMPWAAAALLVALVIAFASITLQVRNMTLGEAQVEAAASPGPGHHRVGPLKRIDAIVGAAPALVHLAIALLLGLALPAWAENWLRQAVAVVAG